MRSEAAFGVLALMLFVSIGAGDAEAGRCGNGVPCRCGDTVSGEAILSEDLGGCAKDGLRLIGDAVLDCDGHEIRGSGRSEGVVLDEAEGAIVRRCRIVGFETGIRIRDGGENLIEENEIDDSDRYGIELAKATTENELRGNVIDDSGDEGVHIGTGADSNHLIENEISDSHKENLYILDADGCTFVRNRLTGGGAAAVYLKHGEDHLFRANTIRDRPVHVRGDSRNNVFTENVLDGAGFIFEAYRDSSDKNGHKGWTAPRDNEVSFGAVLDVRTCFQFRGASQNEVRDVASDGCKPMKESKEGSLSARGNDVELVEYSE